MIILMQFHQHVRPCTVYITDLMNMVLWLILWEFVDTELQGREETKCTFAKQ
jgi:hypothetical protein